MPFPNLDFYSCIQLQNSRQCNLSFPTSSEVRSVEFDFEKNNAAHQTRGVSSSSPILRRGQPFTITLHLNRTFQERSDTLDLITETGPSPSEASGTRAVFRVSGPPVRSSWSAAVQNSSSSSVTLSVTSPANASIGKYSLKIQASKGTPQISALGEFILLFNPWCAADSVFLANEDERQEYVMSEHGFVYQGTSEHIEAMPWDFGQFEADIVHICLELLDVSPKHRKNPGLDCSRRSDPSYVGRVVSAMVNCVDDRGIINGRWDGVYYDGFSPSRWNGSVDILRRWFSCGCQPVKYGQCWVFAAVMCTVMRCLGIPTRPVTNYDSAHDTDGNLTIDEFYTLRYGMKVKESNDSMWNFHVWVESWMARPDLPAGYEGWQVLDPTPQEKSEGVHCCGPAPVKAILEGDTDLKYDVAFVFAEVNADKVCWVVKPDGTMIRDSSDIKTIGKNISTKAVGSSEREDITHLYKYPEGSVKERAVFEKAIQRGSRILKNMLEHSDSYQITKGVQLNFVQETHAVSGKEIAVTLVMFNNSETAKSLTLNINAQVMLYTGRPTCQIWSRRVTAKIGPNTETEFPVSIAYSQYGRILRHSNTVKLTAIAVEDGGSCETSFTEKNVVVSNPELLLEVSGEPVQYQPMMAEVTFFNPLLEPLTDCTMSLTGSGLLFKTIDTCVGTLGPQLRVRLQIPFTPTKTGSRMLTVGFNSDQFCDIKAYTSVTINPPK
ncbi:protein-glutamine gamma-glutamyltransferase 2-like [Acipenser oxyrinchus oxyrinchus]|uniref:protein-glutamine gamma-glutamyltransferase n=1 Tax=Acipenser oxyrinchus oxyrinchus TaxID=40147 RepID=A0AAD8FT14_ACIOX|nr:protein-glutamine gamma-glutamyltransferase 2-like [Acipenser oxyrinchus oxyrinchus]